MPKEDSKNIFTLADDLKQRSPLVNSLPAAIYVESVSGCPYSCIMCDVKESKPKLISGELLRKLEPVYPHLYLMGIHGDGEPLLGNDIDYFIETASVNNIVLHMNSTGFYLTPELTQRLLKCPVLSIRFSLHAARPRTYEKIMRHDLEVVKRNIAYLVKKSLEIGAKDNEFWLSFIVMKENLDEIADFLYLAREIGIKQVRLMRLLPNRFTIRGVYDKKNDFIFNHDEQFSRRIKLEFLERLPRIRALAKTLGISIEGGDMEFECQNIPFFDTALIRKAADKFLPKRRKGFCLAPWLGGCVVKQSGQVQLCCNSGLVIGNLFKQDFAEIWNSVIMQNVRKAFCSGYLFRGCGNCRSVRLEEYPRLVYSEFKDKLSL